MPKYEIESDWVDPYDRVDERRRVPRFRADMKIMIALESGSARRNLVGPGLLKDMSEGGIFCVTKHQLSPGNDLTLRFATDMCPPDLCLPKSFYGHAKVVRTQPDEEDRMFAGIAFGDELKQNMEFSLFVQHLETASLTS